MKELLMAKTTITIHGNLGADVEAKFSKAGKPYSSLVVASTPSKKSAQGEWENGETMWFNVTAFDELNPFEFKKGTPVEISGVFTFRTFTKRDGSQGYALDVVANDVKTVVREGNRATLPNSAPATIPPLDEMPF